MPCITHYPIYGQARPGTGHYVYGGFAYGGYQGWGQADTTDAGVLVRPLRRDVIPPPGVDYARALEQQAARLQTQAMSAAVLNRPRAERALRAASHALSMRAAQAMLGRGVPRQMRRPAWRW